MRRGALLLVGVAALLVVKFYWSRRMDCVRASRDAPLSIAVEVCRFEYAKSQSSRIGVFFSDVLQRNGELTGAEHLATELLASPFRADALQTLGRVATEQKRFELARLRLTQARVEHLASGDLGAAARDANALADLAYQQDDVVQALHMLDLTVRYAVSVDDVAIQFLSHLGAARLLLEVGHVAAAEAELATATPLASSNLELEQLAFEEGNLAQEYDRARESRQELAVSHFLRALERAQQLRDRRTLLAIHLNLAFSLAESGQIDEAAKHLGQARDYDADGSREKFRIQLEARIAFHRGDLRIARSLNTGVYPTIEEHDEALEVCVMQGDIAMALGDYGDAVVWALRGIEHAEEAVSGSRALRPWMAATRRSPYELWFVALARSGRHAEAVQVFDQLQALGVLDDLHGGTPAQTLAESAMQLSELERWLPSTSLAPLARAVEPIVQAATPGVDVLGLVVAEGDVWRVVASEGRLHFDDLGPFEAMRGTLRTFSGSAGDIEIANKLGGQLLPSFLMRRTKAPLHVVLDAAFEGLPVPALAREHRRLAELRPVIRAPRWPRPTTCDPVAIGHARVLADPTGDLSAAADEARSVATRFDEAPLLGRSATSQALLSAPAGSLLHVGLHAQTSTGSQLRLFDRPVSAAEISTMKRAPAVVVLAACESARTSDPALNDALATAFLAAGARYVVATLRPIGDDQAFEVTHAFYARDGAHHPAEALAEVQADLSHSRRNQAWWSFAVFSNEACLPR